REDHRILLSCCNVLAVNLPVLRPPFPPTDRETYLVLTNQRLSGLVLPGRAFQTLRRKHRTACSTAKDQTGRTRRRTELQLFRSSRSYRLYHQLSNAFEIGRRVHAG